MRGCEQALEGMGGGMGKRVETGGRACCFSGHCCKSVIFLTACLSIQGKIARKAILAGFAAWMPHQPAVPTDYPNPRQAVRKIRFAAPKNNKPLPPVPALFPIAHPSLPKPACIPVTSTSKASQSPPYKEPSSSRDFPRPESTASPKS